LYANQTIFEKVVFIELNRECANAGNRQIISFGSEDGMLDLSLYGAGGKQLNGTGDR